MQMHLISKMFLKESGFLSCAANLKYPLLILQQIIGNNPHLLIERMMFLILAFTCLSHVDC